MFHRVNNQTTSSLEKVVTPSSLIIVDGDVVTTYMNADSEFNDDSANENAEAVFDLVCDKSVFHLIIPDSTTHITVAAGNYSNPRFESLKKAEAIVIKTLGHRLLAQFYMDNNKKKYPVKVFNCEKQANSWFESLRANPI